MPKSNPTTSRKKLNHRNRFDAPSRKKKIPAPPSPKINGRVTKDSPGNWKQIHVWGTPYERGYAHGVLLHNELKEVKQKLPFLVEEIEEMPSFELYLRACIPVQHIIKTRYRELHEELVGISHGAMSKNVSISTDFLIAWNCLSSMHEVFGEEEEKDPSPDDNTHSNKTRSQRCSAFIATGKGVTETGDIVMAHNTHIDFIMGSFFHVVIKMTPEKGHEFIMQTCAGYVASASDWFLSASGIIGCETTIGNIRYTPRFDDFHHPFFCRIRNVMQYALNLEDSAQYMLKNNAGDYACSWLFGDLHTNEIMLLEIGLKYYNLKTTKEGIFYGMNSALDNKIRMLETDDTQLYDYTTSSGSRNIRMESLLFHKYWGKLNVSNAKRILADHYDVAVDKFQMNNNTICNHLYLDADEDARFPHGSVDGKVVDSKMAKKLQFWGIWGSSCGHGFRKTPFLQKNPDFNDWKKYLHDYLDNKWEVL